MVGGIDQRTMRSFNPDLIDLKNNWSAKFVLKEFSNFYIQGAKSMQDTKLDKLQKKLLSNITIIFIDV